MLISGQAVTIERVEKDWLFVSIPKLVGWLKIRLHRPLLPGFTIKNLQLTRSTNLSSYEWKATFALEDKSVPEFNPDSIIATWDNSVGMDAVLHENDYLALSNPVDSEYESGYKIESVKSFRKNQDELAKVSKRKSKSKKGSSRRRKLAKREAKIHKRIARARKDHAYKVANKLVRTGKKVFFHEDLDLVNLTKRAKPKKDENFKTNGKYVANNQSAKSGLNKSWNDAAFGNFFKTLEYIAEKAGAKVVAVEPKYTSKLLSYRDEMVFTDTSIREYFDEKEMLRVDRDINASFNIKRVGLELFPTIKSRRGKSAKNKNDSNVVVALDSYGQDETRRKTTNYTIDSSKINVDVLTSTSKEILEELRKIDNLNSKDYKLGKASKNFPDDSQEANTIPGTPG